MQDLITLHDPTIGHDETTAIEICKIQIKELDIVLEMIESGKLEITYLEMIESEN